MPIKNSIQTTFNALEFCCIIYSLLSIMGGTTGPFINMGLDIMFMYLKINLNKNK